MTSVVQQLREPRFVLLNRSVAVFDVSMTALAGYLVAHKMKWSIPLTIAGLFAAGHLTHKVLGIETAFNKIK